MNTLVTICARGGSKGIPKKNIQPINGIPLIGYSIQTAIEFLKKNSGRLELSTDSIEIKNVSAELGLTTEYLRPHKLASDTAGKIEVIDHLFKYSERKYQTKFDFILDLDVSSPLRTVRDIETAFKALQGDKKALNIFSVSKAHRNPYFNVVEKKSNGYYGVVKKGEFKSRQKSPQVFDMNASFYIYRRKFFSDGHTSAITNRSKVHVMDHICFDLDEPMDLHYMNWLVKNNMLGFDINY